MAPDRPKSQVRRVAASVRQKQRKFQQATQRLKEFCARCAINYTMVTTHCDTELAAHHDVALHDHGTLFNAADRKNTGLGRIDDRREVIDAEHAQVRYREG